MKTYEQGFLDGVREGLALAEKFLHAEVDTPEKLEQDILAILRSPSWELFGSPYIAAIKEYRTRTGLYLKEAKRYVDDLKTRNNIWP
jgi:ribosomal protein L7/L12